MHRLILAFALTATACAQEKTSAPGLPDEMPPGIFAARERDGLCVKGLGGTQRAGFVVYGAGDTNCSASGKVEGAKGQWQLVPDGEGACRIPLALESGRVTLGRGTAACGYYCAPGVTFDGKTFTRIETTRAVPTDFAGEPLC